MANFASNFLNGDHADFEALRVALDSKLPVKRFLAFDATDRSGPGTSFVDLGSALTVTGLETDDVVLCMATIRGGADVAGDVGNFQLLFGASTFSMDVSAQVSTTDSTMYKFSLSMTYPAAAGVSGSQDLKVQWRRQGGTGPIRVDEFQLAALVFKSTT